MGTQKRKPRFRRDHSVTILLTNRDIEVLRQVHKHRFLRTTHILSLVEGSEQKIRRRLQRLYHTGYLDRPRCQLADQLRGKNGPMVYALGNRGAAFLAERFDIPKAKVDWTWKNRDVGQLYMAHTLMIAEAMVGLELACKANGRVRLIEVNEILRKAPEQRHRRSNPLSWQVLVARENGEAWVGVCPDGMFGLEFLDAPEGQNRAYFFIECDRATMPIVRRSLKHSSIYKKLVAYYATYRAELHTKLFGIKHFRTLFVTTSAERVSNMLEANKAVTDGRGSSLFLFGRADKLMSGAILDGPWRNGRGELTNLLE